MTTLLLLMLPEVAFASLAGEQRQGQALIAQIRAGTKTCSELTAEDFDHIGDYVMFRALGSTSLHQAMNERMTQMLGPRGESRMHQSLGASYAGCFRSDSHAGYGMMGGYLPGGWSNMMGSDGWGWMMGGNWRSMTRQDWQQIEQRLLGTRVGGDGGWSVLAIIALTLGVASLLAVATLVVLRHPLRRRPGDATPPGGATRA